MEEARPAGPRGVLGSRREPARARGEAEGSHGAGRWLGTATQGRTRFPGSEQDRELQSDAARSRIRPGGAGGLVPVAPRLPFWLFSSSPDQEGPKRTWWFGERERDVAASLRSRPTGAPSCVSSWGLLVDGAAFPPRSGVPHPVLPERR